MRKSKLFTLFILGLVFLYGLGGISVRYINPARHEIFPFFAWDLFDLVPNVKKEYGVEITKYKGTQLNNPVLLEHAQKLGLSNYSVTTRNLIQEFGMQYLSASSQADKSRVLLEKVYLGETNEYRLIKKEYDPVTMYKKGEAKVKTIAVFSIHGS